MSSVATCIEEKLQPNMASGGNSVYVFMEHVNCGCNLWRPVSQTYHTNKQFLKHT